MKDLTIELNKILNDATIEVQNIVKDEAKKIASETSEELIKTSPKRSGKYAKSWRVKEGDGTSFIVHSYKYYLLTHLLEFGHEILVHGKAIGKRSRVFPHIKKAEQKYIKKFMTNIKKRLTK